MAYITPNTTVILLKNCPLDNTYEHTIFFTTKEAQHDYFVGLKKYKFDNLTYQRVEKGTVRLEILADDIYDCNYMMFRNTSFGNKWFYCFVTSIEYINNVTTEVSYEIDVMQTWHFDYDLCKCYVEREHIADDTIGINLAPENVDIGEYVMNDYRALHQLDKMCVIMAVVDHDVSPDGNVYDGVYSGATLFVTYADYVGAINKKIEQYQQKPDAIISMYMCPAFLFNAGDTLLQVEVNPDDMIKVPSTYSSVPTIVTTDYSQIDGTEALDGYTPKNKKMYTYPYNFYVLSNSQGNALTIRYEFCQNLKPMFQLRGSITQPVSIIANPYKYKNVNDPYYSESITLENYPICSWSVDTYAAWVAQNTVPSVMSAITGAYSPIVFGAAEGNLAGGLLSGGGNLFNSVSSLMQSHYKASIAADIVKGSTTNANPAIATNTMHFFGGRCSVNNHSAKIIDEFFTKFGYTKNRLKYPNRNVRPHWTYTKTRGCVITGSVPNDAAKKICAIYDAGITFWKNGSEVGNYDLDNSV